MQKIKKKLVFEKDAYNGEELLLIGPGPSTIDIDFSKLHKKIHYKCTLNDTFLNYLSDFWYSGVGIHLLQSYFQQDLAFFKQSSTMKIFSCHKENKLYNTFVSESQVNEIVARFSLPNCVSVSRFPGDYLQNLQHIPPEFYKNTVNIPLNHYIPSIPGGSMISSLQIFQKLGFSKIFLIGFMDSDTFEHRVTPVKQHVPVWQHENDWIKKELYTQCTIINEVFNQNKCEIINLCPPKKALYHGFQFFTFS